MDKVIEKIKQYGLNFDNINYQILYDAATSIKDVKGIICEIGLREGGGLGVMIMGCVHNHDTDRPFIAIDPYGNIEYKWKDTSIVCFDYDNNMKNRTIKNLSNLCLEHNINFTLYALEDTEFFEKFSNGIPYYNNYKTIYDKYALVHLDGPHTTEDLIKEITFFKDRIEIGGIIVLDDVTGYYNFNEVENFILLENKYTIISNNGKKASYKKIR